MESSHGDETPLDALGLLRQEHATILKQVKSIEDQASRLCTRRLDSSKCSAITESFLEASKNAWQEIFLHIRKEEEGLYPILEEKLAEQGGPVHVMRCEHGELLGSMMTLLTEIVKVTEKTYDGDQQTNVLVRIRRFRSRLTEHMDREDKVIFWLAELNLSKLDRRRVSSQILEISKADENILVRT